MVLPAAIGLSAAAADQLSGKWIAAPFGAAGIVECSLPGNPSLRGSEVFSGNDRLMVSCKGCLAAIERA